MTLNRTRTVFCWLTISVLAWCTEGYGHPLGNYSVNQYFLVDLRSEIPDIYYLLDVAEIPSFREMDYLDANTDNIPSDDEVETYMRQRINGLLPAITLHCNNVPVSLRLRERGLKILSGDGGLPVFNFSMRLEPVDWTWPENDKVVELLLRTASNPNARGFRECMVVNDGRFEIDRGPFRGDELAYQDLVLADEKDNPLFQSFYAVFMLRLRPGSGKTNENGIAGPLWDWTATARSEVEEFGLIAQAGGPVEDSARERVAQANGHSPNSTESATSATASGGEVNGDSTVLPARERQTATTDRWTGRVKAILTTEELTWPVVLLAFVIAAGLGMGHAFSPGHGKTVMAAYLIGERGTVYHAFLLGLIVTITHVWSIFALGVVVLALQEYVTPEKVEFWTSVASGILVVAIGLLLLKTRYEGYVLAKQPRTPAHGHDHDHHHGHEHDHHHHDEAGDHHHAHDHDHGHGHHHHHGHGHGHGHSHVIEGKGGKPPSYGSILALGISGGIVPCPAALVVLLSAIGIGRLLFGMGLIVAFSIGLAAVLVAIGVLVVRASSLIRGRIGERSPALMLLPVFSAILISVLGLGIVVSALIRYDMIVFAPRG